MRRQCLFRRRSQQQALATRIRSWQRAGLTVDRRRLETLHNSLNVPARRPSGFGAGRALACLMVTFINRQ